MLQDSVDTINDLRMYTCWADVVYVRGYLTVGDGGGGVFYRDPASSETDDGGMVIQPSSSLTGRWKRSFETYVNIKWFGAKGDYAPSTDDTTAIQHAIDYLRRQLLGLGDGGTVKGTGLECSLTLFIPRGKYRITSTLELPDYMGIQGDYDAMLVCDDPNVPILRIGGYYNSIQGVSFAGGLHHIVFYGPSHHGWGNIGTPEAGAEVIIRDCTFRYPAGPCIYQDTSLTNQWRGSTANLVVEACEFQGASFFWGTFDGATFRGCYMTIDLSSPPLDDDGKPLAVWNSSGILQVEDVLAVPNSYTHARDGAWFQGSGICHFTRMRFGGESRLTGIRIRTSTTYKGIALPTEKNALACIYISESAMTSFADLNWMEIYEAFPAVIDVRSPIPSSLGGTPYDYMSMVGTWGVWVDTSVSMVVTAARHKYSTLIHLEGFQSPLGFRFRQSDDPTSRNGTDLWPFLRQFMDSEPSPFANVLYPTSHVYQHNLYFPGIYDLSQHNVGGVAVGISQGPADTSTGYALTTYVSVEDGAYFAIELGRADLCGWGQGLPAGEYVLSMYIKASWAGEVLLGRTDQVLAARRLVQANRYQRVWFSFYHDGTCKNFTFGIYDWPNGGTLSVGLFAVHKGATPAPYTFPVDNAAAPTANTTTEDYVQETYRAMGPPTGGTYKQGDIVYNANPQPGEYVGWICVQGTSSNSPALWKAFGAISL